MTLKDDSWSIQHLYKLIIIVIYEDGNIADLFSVLKKFSINIDHIGKVDNLDNK